ncbi:diguanylate cyclase [Azospirillum picis]|uniref:diguanylate cyclase n=1 Tax=Azospirillum picis TaxID=488438 RepID=A0ABU0MM36_9PROT|nr:diguanylate cyclase [Azospirillum picis]MBP2300565.1 diguanylate cyclase (GGDEF)-like protein [Azospirillum picis]MDQ0534534.1 diguanylate cyclase (GGDEF)-like protein [Azospirillum picis]
MIAQEQKVQDWIRRLSETADYAGHPLMAEFRALAGEHLKLMRQLTKIAKISDHIQTDARRMTLALHTASLTDPLTDLPNRRHMIERLEAELAQDAHRDGGAGGAGGLALIMLDIDHFKAVNDELGHAVGDLVLVELASLLRRNLRGNDLCARWGGEEFLILLAGANQSQAETVAEKLRELVERHAVLYGERVVRVTLSLGVATHRAGWSADASIQAADDALYAAKRAGRNRWAAA